MGRYTVPCVIGGTIVILGVAILFIFVFNQDETPSPEDKRPQLVTNAPAEGGTTSQEVAPPTTGPLSDGVAANATPAQATPDSWVVHEEPAFEFRASFPTEPHAFDPAAEIEDPDDRELAQQLIAQTKNLRSEFDGMVFSVTAAPVDLAGTLPATYLNRMARTVPALHRGFRSEDQTDFDIGDFPGKAFLLRSADRSRLIRVIVSRAHVYSLVVEGAANLDDNDSLSQRFFEGFTFTTTEANGDSSIASLGGLWQEQVGLICDYKLQFPGGQVESGNLLDEISSDRERRSLELAWQQQDFQQESFKLRANGRLYAVTAFYDAAEQEAFSLANNQSSRIDQIARFLYGARASQAATRLQGEPRPGMNIRDELIAMPTGGKAILRQVRAGRFSCLIRVEGGSQLAISDDDVMKFLGSIECPQASAADAAGASQDSETEFYNAIVEHYRMGSGSDFRLSNGEIVRFKTTAATVPLDPAGNRYQTRPNLWRDVVLRVGNTVNLIIEPAKDGTKVRKILEVRVVKSAVGNP